MQKNIITKEIKQQCIDYMSDIFTELCHCINIAADIGVEIKPIDDQCLNGESPFARVLYNDNMYNIEISPLVFHYYNKKEFSLIEGSMYHEFIHILDAHCASNTLGINPLCFKRKTKDDFLLGFGYDFWTEFYAYYKSFKHYRNDFKCPSMFYMIQFLRRLIKKEYMLSKDIKEELYDDVLNDIYGLRYLLAQHMAALAQGATSYYKYCDKTLNSNEYKYLMKVMDGIKKYISKMLHGTYGKHMKLRLIKLGEYIYKKIYAPFGMELVEMDDGCVMVYHPYEED